MTIMPQNKRVQALKMWPVALILFAFATAYWEITDLEFINFDDPAYVYENPQVISGFSLESLKWAFTTFETGNYHPVTWLTHMAGVELFGLNPGGHHLINLLFHLANTLLLFYLLNKATGTLYRSLFTAVLFGLHPLLMESVAWISERKDVLSLFLFLLTLIFYHRHSIKKDRLSYALSLIMFTFGLLSKSMLVSTPFILILLDFWPFRRGYDIGNPFASLMSSAVEKLPFFLFTAVFCGVTLTSQSHAGAVQTMESLPLWVRLANAAVSYGHYITHLIYPSDLSIYYPHPKTNVDIGAAVFWASILLIASLFAWIYGKKTPWLLTGWFWFVGALVPVIGIVQVGGQAYANRYAYLPSIGIFILFSWGVEKVLKAFGVKHLYGLSVVAVVLVMIPSTRLELRHWKNNPTIYAEALKNTNNNGLVHNNLGSWYLEMKRYNNAFPHFSQAVRLHPKDPMFRKNLALVYFRLNRFEEAAEQFEASIDLKKDYATPYFLYANMLLKADQREKGRKYVYEGLMVMGNDPADLNNAGNALLFLGEKDQAVSLFHKAFRLWPSCREYFLNYVKSLILSGNIREAKQLLNESEKDHESLKLLRLISQE